jgi:hypothetical protein
MLNILVTKALLPITEALLETFPWVNPSNTDEFKLDHKKSGFTIRLTSSLRIEVHCVYQSGKGIIGFQPGGWIRSFNLGDQADAIGIVWELLEKLISAPQANEGTFKTFKSSGPYSIVLSPFRTAFSAGRTTKLADNFGGWDFNMSNFVFTSDHGKFNLSFKQNPDNFLTEGLPYSVNESVGVTLL